MTAFQKAEAAGGSRICPKITHWQNSTRRFYKRLIRSHGLQLTAASRRFRMDYEFYLYTVTTASTI